MLDVTSWAIVRGHEVFRDDADPDRFWVLPARLELASDPGGRPQLSLIVHRSEDSEGGMLTATVRLATSDDERRLVEDDLRRMLGRGVRVQSIEIARLRVSLGPDDVVLGEGPVSPVGTMVVSTAVTPEVATAIRRAVEGKAPLPLRARLSLEGRRPAIDGTVTIDLARAHAHLTGLGEAPIDAVALRGALGELLEQGVIRLEARSPSARVVDAAQGLLADMVLEPVGSQRWRPASGEVGSGSVVVALDQAAAVSLPRTWSEDLAVLLGRWGEVSVREVDLDADAFFATRELRLEAIGDFAAHEIHALMAEVRADGDVKTEVFEAPGSATVRFRGRPSLQLRTRVVPRSRGDALGARGEQLSEWRDVDEEIVVLLVDHLAPLWAVELRAEAIDWGSHSHLEVRVRYGDRQRSALLTQSTPEATVWIRPEDPERREVELAVRYLGRGGLVERTLSAQAPGMVVIGPPVRA